MTYYMVSIFRSGMQDESETDGPYKTMKDARRSARIYIDGLERRYSTEVPDVIYINDNSGALRAKWDLKSKYIKVY